MSTSEEQPPATEPATTEPPPPLPPEPTERESPTPRPGFPVAGTALLVLSVLLFVTAWLLYEAGLPGTPEFPDQRADYGLDSSVTIYVPTEARLTDSSLNAAYTSSRDGVWEQDLSLSLRTELTQPFPVIVELRGAARVNFGDVAEPEVEAIEFADRQVVRFVASGSNGWAPRLAGTLRISPSSTENFRTAFASPDVGLHMACDSLASVDMPSLTFAKWSQVATACDFPDLEPSIFLVVVGDATPVRVDYQYVSPIESGGSPGFRWTTTGRAARLLVRLSYVDLNGEARAQQMLFLSGVVIGLAAACAPFAAPPLFSYASRLRRRATGNPSARSP